MIIGDINKLKVLKKTDIGYTLVDDKENEYFLHNNETNFRELHPNQIVEAFMFYDNKSRVAATLYKPLITIKTQAFLEVKDKNLKLGAFLNMNILKDLLLSKDYLPYEISKWPKPGDKILVYLDNKKKLLAKVYIPPKTSTEIKNNTAILQKFTLRGAILVTKDLEPVYINTDFLPLDARVGLNIEYKVVGQNDNYFIAIPTNYTPLDKIENNAQVVLARLRKYDKKTINEKMSSEEVLKLFNMSKKDFKKAIGNLYKTKKINITDGYITLIEVKNVE